MAATKDHWSSEAYTNAASFVPQLTAKVVAHLDPRPSDTILDIGCGDGVLTALIAPRCQHIDGLDASQSMISTARATVTPNHANATFRQQDCRRLSPSTSTGLSPASYDKVFSNAAMHWILRAEDTRQTFFADVYALLKPGGAFVFEQGGAGNVDEVHAALTCVLHYKYGFSLEDVARVDPWFFPSDAWMREALERAGFRVDVVELEYRPTKATAKTAEEGGGLLGWVRLMGASFLELLDEGRREEAAREVCKVLRGVSTRAEDGSPWIGYVRLRAVAVKPS